MIVKNGQSILDVCLQEFGTLERLYKLLVDNNLTANSKLISGQSLIINKIGIGDENIKNFVVLKNISYNNDQGEKVPPLLAGDFNIDFNNDYY